MPRILPELLVVSAVVVLFGVGCGSGPGCPTTGHGTLVVQLQGVPDGGSAGFYWQNDNGIVNSTAPATLMNVEAGSYHVRALGRAVGAGTLVRTLWDPSGDVQTVCVRAGATTTVTLPFTEVATSGRLWALNGAGGTGSMLGFTEASLGASGAATASPAADGVTGQGLAFDRDGNLWSMSAANAVLQRYPASALASGGTKTADRTVTLTGLDCVPALHSLAFDPSGNLWVSSPCGNVVGRVPAAALASSGTVAPDGLLTLPKDPGAIAFDRAGNLWVSGESLFRFDQASLGTAGVSPALTLALVSPDGAFTPINTGGMAFSPSGQLWVSDFGANTFSQVPTYALTGNGSNSLTALVQVKLGVEALLDGFAFDEAGGLWTTFKAGSVARLSPTQLTMSGPANPEVKVTSTDIGNAGALVFFPGPTGTALYSATQP